MAGAPDLRQRALSGVSTMPRSPFTGGFPGGAAMTDPIRSLESLAVMRERGLITEDEYQASVNARYEDLGLGCWGLD